MRLMAISKVGVALVHHDPILNTVQLQCKRCDAQWSASLLPNENLRGKDLKCPIDPQHTRPRGRRARSYSRGIDRDDD